MIREKVTDNIGELQQMAAALDEQQLHKAVEACLGSRRIFFSGMGRSGNMVKALAIRFMHLGYEAYVAGDAATPAIEAADLLVAVTSSATTQVTVNHMATAKKKGAKVLMITAVEKQSEAVDYCLRIPARTVVSSHQHAGSLFEQSVLVVGDALCACIQEEKGITTEYMNERHANLQ